MDETPNGCDIWHFVAHLVEIIFLVFRKKRVHIF